MPLNTHPTDHIRQRLLREAIKAGDTAAVRNLQRAAADYRKADMREPERCKSDWLDRCGGLRNVY